MRVRARIIAIDLVGEIRRIRLESLEPFVFSAGQYVFIVHPGGERIPFSIATSPHRLPELEIHYKPAGGNPQAVLMDELLASQPILTLEGPGGTVKLTARTRNPLLIVAGGTGISQAHALISYLGTRNQRAPVTLTWSVARAGDRYCEEDLRRCTAWSWFRLHIVEDRPGDDKNAAVRWIESSDLPGSGRVILCGGPGFVNVVEAALTTRGVDRKRLLSDMFTWRG